MLIGPECGEKVDDPGSKQAEYASRVSVGYKLDTKQGPIEEMPMIPPLPTRLVKCNEWVRMRGVRREHWSIYTRKG